MGNSPSRRILIIEEDQPSTTVLAHLLKKLGHEYMAATNVQDALASIASFRPDIVMYEWNLRAGNGRGLAKRLRAESTSNLNVIAVSTLDEPEHFRETEEVDAYVVKPFDAKRLTRLISR